MKPPPRPDPGKYPSELWGDSLADARARHRRQRAMRDIRSRWPLIWDLGMGALMLVWVAWTGL